jgi:predicted nucleotidyltransferase
MTNIPVVASKERTGVQTDGSPPVPAGRDRRPVSVEAIRTVARQIADRFQPERIILFGSYAHGQPGPESDVDLLVVMDTSLRETDQAVRICQAIEYHFGLDLIVRTPATLTRRLTPGDPFLLEATAKGVVLHERTGG